MRFARGPIRLQQRQNQRPITRPGRSRWPEPDKVRQVLGQGRPWAHPPVHNEEPVWPRASFGLPINGKFQGTDINGQRYAPPDPEDFELRWRDASGQVHDRLASPLVLKALPLADGRYAPIALWLGRGYPEGGVVGLQLRRSNDALIEGSAAPFDRLRAAGDPVLYQPLEAGESMKDVFVKWLETEKKLTKLGGDAP